MSCGCSWTNIEGKIKLEIGFYSKDYINEIEKFVWFRCNKGHGLNFLDSGLINDFEYAFTLAFELQNWVNKNKSVIYLNFGLVDLILS